MMIVSTGLRSLRVGQSLRRNPLLIERNGVLTIVGFNAVQPNSPFTTSPTPVFSTMQLATGVDDGFPLNVRRGEEAFSCS